MPSIWVDKKDAKASPSLNQTVFLIHARFVN